MRVTIKDVARAADVSPSTVSMVLNKKPVPILQETRDRVLRAAKELGYRAQTNPATARRTNTIGLIIPEYNNLFHMAYCECIEGYARQQDYSVSVRAAHGNLEETIRFLRDFEDRGADGVILHQSNFVDPEDAQACMRVVQDLRIPVMLTDRVPLKYADGAVMADDYLGGRLAAQHLVDLGHRRIGCITGGLLDQCCRNRIRGYSDVLRVAGIAYDPNLIFEGDWGCESGKNALMYLLDRQVTAIFCFNDMMAYGVYKQARECGVRIPENLSLVGYDDLVISDVMDPPLTSLKYPIDAMAEKLVECMIAKINGEQISKAPMFFDPVLCVKGSTAPYAG